MLFFNCEIYTSFLVIGSIKGVKIMILLHLCKNCMIAEFGLIELEWGEEGNLGNDN